MDPVDHRLLAGSLRGTVLAEEPLARHVTFCIGGPAELLVLPADLDDVRRTLEYCLARSQPLYLLGGGSNLLPPDEGLRGVVLCTRSLSALREDHGAVVAGAGTGDEDLARFAEARGWAGFEWIYDLPGTVGGAVFMNAGNNDGELAAHVLEVAWLDPEGTLHRDGTETLELGYRTSRFHRVPGLVTEARLRPLGSAPPGAIRERMEGIRAARKARFPPETLCAGSVFKRPPGDYAGRLIEAAGCGGLRRGGAKVSEKHKGFIVNTGRATAGDVIGLVEEVIARVRDRFGVELQREMELFGERRFL